jgi:transcriptional regulator with GAF, ATPase, and Fis domain/serine/threonine protein kinase/tetratricopeptide (TPR) repeat protein
MIKKGILDQLIWAESHLLKQSEICTVSLNKTADGSSYIVKKYQRDYANQARNEFLFLQTVKAEHVPQAVKYLSAEEPEIVIEHIEGKAVTSKAIQACKDQDAIFARLAYDLAQIHVFGICLNDLKPDNLVLVKDSLYIIDFGLATINLHFDRFYRGTREYAAPEKILRQTNHYAGDVFALGMTIFYCKHGKTIFDYVGETDYANLLTNPELWDKQLDLLETDTLLKSLLRYNAGSRFTALEAARQFASRGNCRLKSLDKTTVENYVFRSQTLAVELLIKKKSLRCCYADETQKIEGLLALTCESSGTKLLTLDESLFLTHPEEFFKPFPIGYRDNNIYQSRFIEWLNEQHITVLLRRNRQIKPTGFFDEIFAKAAGLQIWIDQDSELKAVSAHELNDLLSSLPSLDRQKADIKKKISSASPLMVRMLLLQALQPNANVLESNELIDFLAWIGNSIPLVLIQQIWDNWHILVHDALLKRKIIIEGNVIRAETLDRDRHPVDPDLIVQIISLAEKSSLTNIAGEASYILGDNELALKNWSLYVDELIRKQYFVSAYEFINQVTSRIPHLPFDLKKKEAFLARICGYFSKSYQLYQILLQDSDGLMKAVLSVDQAVVLQTLGKHEEAVQAYRNAIDLFRIHKDYKGLLRAMNNLGVVYFELKRYAEAEQVFNDVLAEARQYESIQFETISYINLSDIQLKRGEWKRALYYAEKAMHITRSNQKWNLYFNASTIVSRANMAMGEPDIAWLHFEQIYHDPKAAQNILQYQENLAWYIHYTQIYRPAETSSILSSISFADSSLHDILMRELFFVQISRKHYLQAYKYLQNLAEVSIIKAFFDSDTDAITRRIRELKSQSETDSYLYYLTQYYRLFPIQAKQNLQQELQEAWDLYMYHPLQQVINDHRRQGMDYADWDELMAEIDNAETPEQIVSITLQSLSRLVPGEKFSYLEYHNGNLTAMMTTDGFGCLLPENSVLFSQTLLNHLSLCQGFTYLYPAYNYVSMEANSSALGLGISTAIGFSLYLEDKLIGLFYCDKNDGAEFELQYLAQAKLLFSLAQKSLTRHYSGTMQRIKNEVTELDNFEPQTHQMIGSSKAMQDIYAKIDLVAGYDVNVLITGPTGSGKELVARAIHKQFTAKHQNLSKAPFVAVNCAAIPEQLLESELFGYKKGAFTGAYNDKKGKILFADKGSLFLDEIGEMPMLLQTKLLRVLQEKMVAPLGSDIDYPVNVRIITATNQNLEERVAQNLFRSDLFYRLKVVTIELPSLSARKEDIPLIAMFYIKKFSEKFHKNITGIHPATIQYLQSKPWNGNVRELENELERAVLLCTKDYLSNEDFSADSDSNPSSIFRNLPLQWQGFKDYKQRISDELDKRYIKQLLFEAGDNIMTASKLGNLERMQIYRLMKKN